VARATELERRAAEARSFSVRALAVPASTRMRQGPAAARGRANDETALGPDHLSVATNLHNLAEEYHVQGRYADAKPLYRRALAVLEESPEPARPNVATDFQSYAALLRELGRKAEAVAVAVEARAEAIEAGR